jgi:Carbohydrate-selective porin, OprB family
MTFNHPTAANTALFTATPPPLVSTKNAPRSSELPITTQQYSLLLKLQQQYISPTNFTNKPPNNRREFAIALQSLIDLTLNNQASISLPDLAAIDSLKQSFAPELATLPKQAKATAPPEPTTYPIGTKLSGEVLLSGVAIGGDPIEDEDNNDRRITAGYRARLNINTSFTGFDRLRIRLQNSDIAAVNRVTGSDMSRLSYQGNTRGQIVLNRLEYRFPIDTKINLLPMEHHFLTLIPPYTLKHFIAGRSPKISPPQQVY